MTADYFLVLAIIAVLSVVQSLFGMGILVFGTPTLLLMGYDFNQTLGHLLPASFAVSLLQIVTAGENRPRISKQLYVICLPGIALGLWLAENTFLAAKINMMVGMALLLSAALRGWPQSRKWFRILLAKQFPAYHLVMGVIHGLTNLGGALLAVLASETAHEKHAIRYTVASYYLAFSVAQMLFLTLVMGLGASFVDNLPGVGVSAIVYMLVGRRVFTRASPQVFHHALTFFIAAYGVVVLLKS